MSMQEISVEEIHTFSLSTVVTFEPPIEVDIQHGFGSTAQMRKQAITEATYYFTYNARESMEQNLSDYYWEHLKNSMKAHNVRKDGSVGQSIKSKYSIGNPNVEGRNRLAKTADDVRAAFAEAITKTLDTKGLAR
jgi:hypothetical protein